MKRENAKPVVLDDCLDGAPALTPAAEKMLASMCRFCDALIDQLESTEMIRVLRATSGERRMPPYKDEGANI